MALCATLRVVSVAAVTDLSAKVVQQGAQEAASALSRLLRRPFGVEGFGVIDVSDIPRSHGRIGVVLAFEATGGFPGHLAFVIDEDVAAGLVASLTGADHTELNTSALMALAEVGNIAASAFLNGAARVTSATCMPSVPRTSHAPVEQAVRGALPPRPAHIATLRVDGNDVITVAFVA